MKGYGRGNRYRCGKMEGADLTRLQFVVEIDGSPTPVGLAGIVPAVPVVVGSQLSRAVLPVSSSSDTYRDTRHAYHQSVNN